MEEVSPFNDNALCAFSNSWFVHNSHTLIRYTNQYTYSCVKLFNVYVEHRLILIITYD
jgi:hypothetical protein